MVTLGPNYQKKKAALSQMEKRIQRENNAGKYVEVRLSQKERMELRQVAALTLARIEAAELVLRVRKKLGVSRIKLAKILGTSSQAVKNWELLRGTLPIHDKILFTLADELKLVRSRLLLDRSL